MKRIICLTLILLTGLGIGAKALEAAQTTIQANAAIAPLISFSLPVPLNFGELAIPNSTLAGSYTIDENTGAATATNAIQLSAGTVSRGSVTITGRKATNINFSITTGAFTCDPTYLNGPCTGTGGLDIVATHTFGTDIDDTCPGVRCSEVVNIGGTFSFPAGAEGRWTTDLTITANYQ